MPKPVHARTEMSDYAPMIGLIVALSTYLTLGDVVSLHDDHVSGIEQSLDVDRERLEVLRDLRENVLEDGIWASVDPPVFVTGRYGPLDLRMHRAEHFRDVPDVERCVNTFH
jgi:hypothetical protein